MEGVDDCSNRAMMGRPTVAISAREPHQRRGIFLLVHSFREGNEWLDVCLTPVLWSRTPSCKPKQESSGSTVEVRSISRTGHLMPRSERSNLKGCRGRIQSASLFFAILARVRNNKSFAEEYNCSTDLLTWRLPTQSGGCALGGVSAGMFSPGQKATEHY